MATPIIMPKFGQMTEESAIVEWLKKEGDKVAKGDILFTVETDKSVMEVESFEEGTLLKIVVPPGVNVPVQSTVGFLGKPGEADSRGHRARACRAASRRQSEPPPASGCGSPLPRRPRLPHHQRRTAALQRQRPPQRPQPSLFRISPRAAALAKRFRH